MKTLKQKVLAFDQVSEDAQLYNLLYDYVIGHGETDLVAFLHERIENNNAGAEWWTQGDLEAIDEYFYVGVDCTLASHPMPREY